MLTFYTSRVCRDHRNYPFLAERPARWTELAQHLVGAMGAPSVNCDPVDYGLLTRVHDRDYVERVRDIGQAGFLRSAFAGLTDPRLQWYQRISDGTYAAARYAAGAVTDAVRDVLAGKTRRAFCIVRPPGHHAEAARAAGFCVFNNVAIGAVHALEQGAGRVAIVDFDRHHGNGTEQLVRNCNTDRLFFASTFQEGCKYNTPDLPDHRLSRQIYKQAIPLGSDGQKILGIYNDLAGQLAAFKPELLLLSAGFDMEQRDPLSGLGFPARDYYYLTRSLLNATRSSTGGRVVSVLEGGYHLRSLYESAGHHLAALRQD